MKQMFQAAIVAAAVLAVPALSLAAQTPKPATTKTAATTPAPKPMAAKAAAVHSARSVVKSMDAATLVIAEKTGKKTRDVQFVLDPAAQKDGSVAVGSTVQVKYHNDAKQHVATTVKAAAAARKS